MKDLIRLIFSKKFFANILIAIILIIAIIWGTLRYLDTYTEHSQSITVPDFVGFKINQLDEFIADKQLRDSVIDSVYYSDYPKGTIVTQDPPAGSQVKKNRMVYLTVNATSPQKITMPNLMNLSLRQAMAVLDNYGLKVDSLRYIPNQCFNCVVGQEMKGKEIKAGDWIEKGKSIVIVLGQGESDEKIAVPYLLHLTKELAVTYLNSKFLNVGIIDFEDCKTAKDSLEAKVYKQYPSYLTEGGINLGAAIDIFLTIDESKLPPIDSLNIDTGLSITTPL